MNDLVINNTEQDLVISGSDNSLDVVIENTELVIEAGSELSVSPVEINLDLSVDDVSLDINTSTVEILSVAEQGPMGPAGPAGSGSGEILHNIFDQIDDDSAYRGDSVLGTLTSQPLSNKT